MFLFFALFIIKSLQNPIQHKKAGRHLAYKAAPLFIYN